MMTFPTNFKQAWVAIFGGTAVLVVLTFLLLYSVFPWMTPWSQTDEKPKAAPAAKPLRTVDAEKVAPAERVLDRVAVAKLPGFDNGWTAAAVFDNANAAPVGFGCEADDGLAPVTARTRTYVKGDANPPAEAVTLTLQAYPAGGGAKAMNNIVNKARECSGASVGSTDVKLGAQTEEITNRDAAILMWRRGDVLVTAVFSAGGRRGDPSSKDEALRALDRSLAAQLRATCANQFATFEDSSRSPYLGRADYRGFRDGTPYTVNRRADGAPPAEQVTQDPIVPIPAPEETVQYLTSLPGAPNPLPTGGPKSLPTPVTTPEYPKAPTHRKFTLEIKEAVPDKVGPGCGWDFTGQQQPVFDSQRAAVQFDQEKSAAEKEIERRWSTWQDARLKYWADYAAYKNAIPAYTSYVNQVLQIEAQWNVINGARQAYYDARGRYDEEVRTRNRWFKKREAAQRRYVLRARYCREAVLNPTPTPGQLAKYAQVCPATPEPILRATPPPPPNNKPTPSPEAQLPRNAW